MVTADTDVTLFTPIFAPRVTDDPVIDVVLSTVTDTADGMVEEDSGALAVIVDTGVVQLEGGVAGIDANGSRAVLSDVILEMGLGEDEGGDVLLDLGVGGLGGVEVALSNGGVVWIFIFVLEETVLVLLDVVESSRGDTTVAARAAAIDEVLLGEGIEVLVVDGPGRLHGLDCGEGPAGAALGLILDGVDNARITPIEGIGGVELLVRRNVVAFFATTVTKESFVFSWSHCGKFVQCDSPGVAAFVMLFNKTAVLGVDTKTKLVFITNI